MLVEAAYQLFTSDHPLIDVKSSHTQTHIDHWWVSIVICDSKRQHHSPVTVINCVSEAWCIDDSQSQL